jgi:uncharacterized protein YdiU (UPF0061 family)
MQTEFEKIWCAKLGLVSFEANLFESLIFLMIETHVDFTIFFRELSKVPDNVEALKKSFHTKPSAEIDNKWQTWLKQWRALVLSEKSEGASEVAVSMKKANPKYTWREWLIVPAYEQAAQGNYSLIKELQEVLGNPYEEQSEEVEAKYYRLRPDEFIKAGGVSHYSCSS